MPPWRELAPILIAIWVPVFVGALDTTIVATLQSSVASQFHRAEHSQWLGTSFFLATCCFTPLYGRLCDPALLGRRYTLLLSTVIFALATLLCGLAPSMNTLIAARFVAGMGAGGVSLTSSVITSDRVPLRNRGILQGALNILWGLGSGLGGPLGGWMNDRFGWRNAFLLQMPLLVFSFVLVLIWVQDLPPPSGQGLHEQPLAQRLKQIDVLGSLTLLVGLGSTITVLTVLSTQDEGQRSPWVWALCLVGLFNLALFIRVEQRATRPILPLRLLHCRIPLSHALTNFCISGGAVAFLYITPLFFQAVRLQSASIAGQHLSPYSLAVALASLGTGVVIRATGRYYSISIGMNCLQILSPLAFSVAVRVPSVPDWAFYLLVLPQGLGGVSVITATLVALINAVERSDIALATGLSYLFRNAGQAVIVSGSGILLQSLLALQLRRDITGPGSQELIARIRHETALIPSLPLDVREQAVKAYAQALHVVYLALAAVGMVALVCNACMQRKPLPGFDDAKPLDAESEEEEIPSEV